MSNLPPPALRTGQRRRLPLALLTTDLLPCPALRAGSLCSKVSRGAACCQYNCSSRLSGEPVSPLPQYTTLLWSLRALDYCRTFRQLLQSCQKDRQQPRLNRGLMLEGCAKLIVVTHPEVGAVVYMFSSVIPAKCRNFSFVLGVSVVRFLLYWFCKLLVISLLMSWIFAIL